MPSTKISLLGFSLLIGAWTVNSLAQEFEENISNSDFSRVVEPMGELIQLVEADGMLKISRDWDKKHQRATAGLSDEEQLEKLIAEQVERGLPKDFAERHAKRMLERGNQTPAIRHQFDKVQKAVGRGGGSGGGGGGDDWRWRFESGKFSGNLEISADRLGIRFADSEFGVNVDFAESNEGKLQFRVMCDAGIVALDQSDERIRLAVIHGDTAAVYLADNYQQLKEKHPVEVRRFLYDVWKSFGIQRPLSTKDPAVVDAILEKIRAVDSDGMEVYGLLEALTGDSISARDSAEKSLTENFYKWSDLVAKYEEEFEFDEQAAKRLRRIQSGHLATPIQDYVNTFDLNDKDVLIQIWENTPKENHPDIIRRLEATTGLSLGDDVQAWKDVDNSPDE